MYLDFYRLTEEPFSIAGGERFFYESPAHREALANMMYTIQQRKGMVMITGEVGAGKTFLCGLLASRLGPTATVVRVKHPPQSGKQLIRTFAARLGLPVRESADKQTVAEALERHLDHLATRGHLVALILDECQDLPPQAMEEIRLLWNWEQTSRRLVQIVLVGQPELRQRVREPKWEPLRQRIVLAYHLVSLTPEEAGQYIDHRIAVAGRENCQLRFDDEAKRDIHRATRGVPRLINVLCDNALLIGYTRETQTIGASIVRQVTENMTCWDLQERP